MKIETRYSNHPEDSKKYDTNELRKHYLIESIFVSDEANLVYSHNDRIIVGGITPVSRILELNAGKELGVNYFFERREAGVINIGGKGIIVLDGLTYELDKYDGLYIGMLTKEVKFSAVDKNDPPKFYFNSAPAHTRYESRIITLEQSRKVEMGETESLNVRTINQYLHPYVLETCQLVMGMTVLKQGSVWNTMPCHTHERRMEVYMYFNMDENTRIMHFMGQPQETRHLIISNEQGVISPSWSIHSGVGTSNYNFIWGMCGENIEFTDMDHVDMKDLR